MPSVSKKQHNFMAAVANNPKFAKKAGVPQSVGEEFLTADKGKKFRQGGTMKASKTFKDMEKKEVEFMKKKGAPKSMIRHEKEEMKEEKAEGYCGGGKMKKYAKGGAVTEPRARKIADEEVKKHEKRMHSMAKGGLASGHKSADGCAVRGKTRGLQPTMMKKGGKC